MSDDRFFQEIWAKLSEVAVKGAQYNSPERHPHPKCLEGTRVDLLKYIYGFLDDPEKNKLIWLHGTAGVGKSAVAFTVAERMKSLKVTEETKVEKRLAGTFFFSRKHTKRCTARYFFATLVHQLATNFPSIRKDINRTIHDNPALLDPDTPLCDQMEALFLQPLRKLQLRLRGCPSLSFVVDALDECTSEPELADLILSLAQALRDPDIPVTHILLTSRSETHISEVFQNEEVRQLLWEIPVKTSGEGVAAIISLDGADVDADIYVFLQHSFAKLACRHPDFPQPTRDELSQLAVRAGRRFIVASTMMKFIIDDEEKDPRDRVQLMLKLTSSLLPGTEVYKLYDCILSTCADPKRAYMHLSIVAALADPLPISQISTLLGPGLGRDVQTTLIQLRSIMDVPTDNTVPVNIYHSSVRDYVSDPSNCSLPPVRDIASPHTLLACSSPRLIMAIPASTALLDVLLELKKHSKAMQPEDAHRLKDSLGFLVRPPGPLSSVICMMWLRGDRTSDLQYWLETVDGHAWLGTQGGRDWLQTEKRRGWLRTRAGREWLRQRWMERQWLRQSPKERESLWQSRRERHSLRQSWRERELLLQSQRGREGLRQSQGGREWLWKIEEEREWLETERGLEWPETMAVQKWLDTESGQEWLQTELGREWLQTESGREWLETEGGQEWLESKSGRGWLETESGRMWLETEGGQEWLESKSGRAWLQTESGREWLQTESGQVWLQTEAGRRWLHTERGRRWLQTPPGQMWQSTPAASVWMTMEEFVRTLEAINEYIVISDVPLLPAFQVIQQFKTLPDFLMFPVFLALRHRQHSTSALPESVLPDREILHAMNAFQRFGNEAHERSQSASEALKYACHNWALHLSRAPNPWDDTLDHIFQAFWNTHSIPWLEMEWCLNGLQPCLVILTEGQKFVKSMT
jgi:hypothetical protein